MKYSKKNQFISLVILIVGMMLLSSCLSASDPQDQTTTQPDQKTEGDPQIKHDFWIMWQNEPIRLHEPAESVVAQLGEPLNYFEAESCAFEGIDKIFTYSSIEISTVPINGHDVVSQVVLLDDTVATKEGVYMGNSLDDVTQAYGASYEVKGSGYFYTNQETQLMFIIEDETVTAIEYIAVFN